MDKIENHKPRVVRSTTDTCKPLNAICYYDPIFRHVDDNSCILKSNSSAEDIQYFQQYQHLPCDDECKAGISHFHDCIIDNGELAFFGSYAFSNESVSNFSND